MKAEKIWFDNDNLYVRFDTGHIIGNPLVWFEWLKNANLKTRENYILEPFGIWWNDLEEGLSYEGLFSYKNELWKSKETEKIQKKAA